MRLPPVATSFVGRDADVATGRDLLTRPRVRVLTLTGPGGVGKTRLALAIARQAGESFPEGVVFVPLAAIRDPALVVPTIAQRLDLPDQASWTSHSGLSMFLRARQMLLVLDNFEQVIAGAPEVSRLLDACPDLKLIVTSRVPLRIDGEHEYGVSPLPVPGVAHLNAEAIAQLAAVELFVERARAANPVLTFNDAERVIIAEICRQVDGLPLAIELAAARSRSLTPAEMLERLAHRLPLLVSDGREGPIRQLTMRDTIAWSYDLLSADEQALFRRLAVFTGGFAQDAAEAVCHALGCFASQCIGALIDQSLVRRVARPGAPERLRLMETIREFALEQLEASGESDAARRWHAGYFAAIAAEAEHQLVGSEQVAWFDRLEREHDNLRAALAWSIETGAVDIGLAIGAGLWRFWERRGHVSEGRPLLERIIALAGDVEPSREYASALFGMGRLRYVQGDFVSARSAFTRLLDVGNALGSDNWLSAACTQLAHLATREGNYQEARRLAEEGLALRRRAGDHWGTAISLLVLGRNAHYLGDDDRAAQLTEESIAIFGQLGDKHGMSDGYDELGEFALGRGKFALARGHIEQALALHQELGDDMAVADSLALLGYIAIGQRNYNGARSLFTRSLTRLIDLGARWRIDPALEGLAEVALVTGEPQRAVRILAAADRMRTELRAFLDPDARERQRRNLDAARSALGDAGFEGAWEAGRALSIDQVSAEALAIGQPVR